MMKLWYTHKHAYMHLFITLVNCKARDAVVVVGWVGRVGRKASEKFMDYYVNDPRQFHVCYY